MARRICWEGLKEGKGGGEEVRWCGLLGTSLLRGGGVGGGLVLKIFVFVLAEVNNFPVACSGRSLEDRTMDVGEYSEGHSNVAFPVLEIPRWTLPRARQRLESPVGCSLPYFVCWSRWVDQIYEGGCTILLVVELVCATLLDGRSCQGTSVVGGQFAS